MDVQRSIVSVRYYIVHDEDECYKTQFYCFLQALVRQLEAASGKKDDTQMVEMQVG